MAEHAVIVHFNYGLTDLRPLLEAEKRLTDAIALAGVGEFDGDEIAVNLSDGSLYMYGPDADRLYTAMRPSSSPRRSCVARRSGSDTARRTTERGSSSSPSAS